MSKDSNRVTTREFYEMQIETNKFVAELKGSVDTYTATAKLRMDALEKEQDAIKKKSDRGDRISIALIAIGAFLGARFPL